MSPTIAAADDDDDDDNAESLSSTIVSARSQRQTGGHVQAPVSDSAEVTTREAAVLRV